MERDVGVGPMKIILLKAVRNLSFFAFAALLSLPASAASCGGDFGSWLASFKREAATQGVGARGLAALDGLSPDPDVIRRDHSQGVFRQSFEQFGPHRVNPLLAPAASRLRRLKPFLD